MVDVFLKWSLRPRSPTERDDARWFTGVRDWDKLDKVRGRDPNALASIGHVSRDIIVIGGDTSHRPLAKTFRATHRSSFAHQ
jgi:hypothetical protein